MNTRRHPSYFGRSAWKQKQSPIHHQLTIRLIFAYTSPAAKRLCFRFNLRIQWERRRLLTRCWILTRQKFGRLYRKGLGPHAPEWLLMLTFYHVLLFFCYLIPDGHVSSYYSTRLGGEMDVSSRLDSAETEWTVFGVGVLQNYTRYGKTVFHCSRMN